MNKVFVSPFCGSTWNLGINKSTYLDIAHLMNQIKIIIITARITSY